MHFESVGFAAPGLHAQVPAFGAALAWLRSAATVFKIIIVANGFSRWRAGGLAVEGYREAGLVTDHIALAASIAILALALGSLLLPIAVRLFGSLQLLLQFHDLLVLLLDTIIISSALRSLIYASPALSRGAWGGGGWPTINGPAHHYHADRCVLQT